MTLIESSETAIPDDPARPWWLSGPCPPWCTRGHRDDDSGHEERLHNGQDVYMDLSQEPLAGRDASFISAGIWQGYRDSRPHILLTLNDRDELYLELAEAEEAARLLAAQPGEWSSLTLTMMASDPVMPSGDRAAGRSRSDRVANFAAWPFTRPAVFAVREVLGTVMVFTPFQAGPYHEQSPRYLALAHDEAADLAAAIVKLLAGAK